MSKHYSIHQALMIIIITLYISTSMMILALSRPSGAMMGIGMLTIILTKFLLFVGLLFFFDFKINIELKDLIKVIVILNVINIIGSKQFIETRGEKGFNLLIIPYF